MIKYMVFMLLCAFSSVGCFGYGMYDDYEPLTPLTAEQWGIVNAVEARVKPAEATFGLRGFGARPQITVVTSADQFVPKFQRAWKDVPAYYALQERVPGEGVSGMWDVPDIFISTIGDRATKFLSLYALTPSFQGAPGTRLSFLRWLHSWRATSEAPKLYKGRRRWGSGACNRRRSGWGTALAVL